MVFPLYGSCVHLVDGTLNEAQKGVRLRPQYFYCSILRAACNLTFESLSGVEIALQHD
jgi:hypothetical protein